MKLAFYTLGVLLAFSFLSCNKDKRDLFAPPPLLIVPRHNYASLPDNELNGIKLYYILNQKKYVPDFGRATGSGYQYGILSTSDIASISAVTNVKYYYLSYPDGTEDTLFVNYVTISDKDARDNTCFCAKPLISFKVNGQTPAVDTVAPGGIPLYIINH